MKPPVKSSGLVLRVKSDRLPRQNYELARIRVLRGVDAGVIGIIRGPEVTLGRGEKADFICGDLGWSRIHARLVKTDQNWIIRDESSHNGILFRGNYVREVILSNGDHFMIGDTLLDFFYDQGISKALAFPPAEEIQKRASQEQALLQKKAQVHALGESKEIIEKEKNPEEKKRALLLLGGAIVAGLYLYQDQIMDIFVPKKSTPKKSIVKKENEENRSLASYAFKKVSPEAVKESEKYYRDGFREYTQKNYLRAKSQFELALQLNPLDERTRRLLQKSDQELKEEVQKLLNSGRKAYSLGKLQESKGFYETALRHAVAPQDPAVQDECKQMIDKIEKESRPSWER